MDQYSSITPVGGGGVGGWNTSSAGQNGYGGGGGGCRSEAGGSGAAGGDGVIIVRYKYQQQLGTNIMAKKFGGFTPEQIGKLCWWWFCSLHWQ